MLAEDCSRRDLADCLDLGKYTAHDILTEDLHMRHVSLMWVPHILTDENKQSLVNCAKHIRRLFFREGTESFCNKVAVQDETWIYLLRTAEQAGEQVLAAERSTTATSCSADDF